MADPTLYVEAYLNGAWTDLSAYCEHFRSRRGRNTNLDQIEAGQGSVLLRSPDDARFDPNNPDGPYYGFLKPSVPIRVLADTSGAYTTGGEWVSENLLNDNQASLETNTTGWAAKTNCSIARTTAQAADGAASLSLTSTAAGDMEATTPTGTSGVPISPSTEYTILASFRTAVSARTCSTYFTWYTDAGVVIADEGGGVTIVDSTSAWTQRVLTATSPSNAAYAAVNLYVAATGGASEVHYVDKISLAPGTSTSWGLRGAFNLPSGAEPIIVGKTRGWPQEFVDRFDVEVPVRFVDAFRTLNLNKITATYSAEASGTRVTNVLDDADFPDGTNYRLIDAGASTVQAATVDGSPLEHLQLVATSEAGYVLIDRYGRLLYIDRDTIRTRTLDTGLTWGDDASERPYAEMVGLGADADDLLRNAIEVTAPSLATQTAEDAASIAEHDRLVLSISTLITTTGEMLSRAQWARSSYSQPAQRIRALVLDGQGTDQWPTILAREVGDKIRVRRRPEGGNYTIEQDSVIEAIEFEVTAPNNWRVTWTLSPVDAGGEWFVFGSSTGKVDVGRLTY